MQRGLLRAKVDSPPFPFPSLSLLLLSHLLSIPSIALVRWELPTRVRPVSASRLSAKVLTAELAHRAWAGSRAIPGPSAAAEPTETFRRKEGLDR